MNPRSSALALASLATLLLVGCGAQQEPGAPEASRLVVREELPPQPLYDEGSISFLRVEAEDSGAVVVNGPMTDGLQVRGKDPLLDRSVDPGEYLLVSHQRPCHGNCDQLDPATDRCEAILRLEPAQTLTATVVLRQAGGCEVREG